MVSIVFALTSRSYGVHRRARVSSPSGRTDERERRAGDRLVRDMPLWRDQRVRPDSTYDISQRGLEPPLEQPRERDETQWEIRRRDRDDPEQGHLDGRVPAGPDVHERKSQAGG
jgi:hypothetical protein